MHGLTNARPRADPCVIAYVPSLQGPELPRMGEWSAKNHPHAPHDDIVYPAAIPFVLVHVACFGAIWTGVPKQALWVALALYFVRMWAITAGYHRYFSDRSY